MSLPRREVKADWVAQRGDRGMYRDAQAATATPDGLTFFSPPFLAPALCWWALTMVESIITYPLSASCARASKMRHRTPARLYVWS